MKRCEFYEDGYCVHERSIEEQEKSETFWECDGSEESQIQCGIKELEE